MKSRSRFRRQRSMSPQRKALGAFGRGRERKRKSWTFERLEDRFCFSISPTGLETVSFSNATPEGAALIMQREMEWALRQAADAATNPATLDELQQELQQQYTRSLPNDPLFPSQWHLLNVGQEVGNPDFQRLFGVFGEDINVVPVWNMGYTGEGVLVAVMDSGVQMNHPDLIGNLHPTLRFNAITGTSNPNPSLFEPGAFHGTAVAGLIGMTWNNAGDFIEDINGDLILDINGNPVREGGGVGVAPNVSLVPVRLVTDGLSPDAILRAFQFAIANDIDITNNSWGPFDNRSTDFSLMSPEVFDILRHSVLFGRGGLGMINLWASGNGAGPSFSPGFDSFGNYDSAAYDVFVSSRYTIGIAGVDHDGLYINSDGTFTSYPEAGPGVLVSAPTGSNVAQTVANDSGQGSGLWTADLIGDFGFNSAPLPSGFDPDRDLLADPNYTSRFNGTSGASPIAAGVVALMLEANPNLTYRDVQEILLRSARQNAQFEIPSSGGLQGFQSTWQTNQVGPFRTVDPWFHLAPGIPGQMMADPLADTTLGNAPNTQFLFPFAPYNDIGRQLGHFEPMPANFTNGAGYTVSQGYGIYGEQMGFAHGVIDAELAVKMALQWHELGQNLDPFTERTFTTFVVQTGLNFPSAEERPNNGLLVPGGIGGLGGFIDYWNEYFEDPPAPFDPAEPDDWPVNSRGLSYLPFVVPPDEQINAEWVEVKIEITGPAEDLDYLRIMLASPNGMQSELNHYYGDPEWLPTTIQLSSAPATGSFINPAGNIDNDGGSFIWTFSTNQMFGESTNTAVIIDPVTGEPVIGPGGAPVFRNWELYMENWSNSDFGIAGVEITWHGKPVEGGGLNENWLVADAQRVQGFVGIDSNNDNQFNYNRYTQSVFDPDNDPLTMRNSDVVRILDTTFQDNNSNGIFDAGDVRNQEAFAENILVEAYRVDPDSGEVDADPTAQFLTGADGNYYFDLDPNFEYEIRITDPLNRIILEDTETPEAAPPGLEYLGHFKQSWRITPDWFFAPDRDNSIGLSQNPGEIFMGMHDANGDGISTLSPQPFIDMGEPIPMAVKNVNFLIKQDAPPASFEVTGTVYLDFNGDGIVNLDDVPAPGITVFQDVNRNGVFEVGTEQNVETDENGEYTLTIPATAMGQFQIGVVRPSDEWEFTDPGFDGLQVVIAGPGSPEQIANFFLLPSTDGDPGENGNIAGIVFNDLDTDGIREPGEVGLPGITIYIDVNTNGTLDSGDVSTVTGSNGGFVFTDLDAGIHRIEIHIEEEGTDNALWRLTSPAQGFREVALSDGGTVSGVLFGVENMADGDWGDLPDTYSTTAAENGPTHTVIPGFQMGNMIDGEVNGLPDPNADGDDDATNDDEDGLIIRSNGGQLRVGANTFEFDLRGVGGFLNGWMDLNGDGDFDDAGEHVVMNERLNQGTRQLNIEIPAGTVGGQEIAARFRWGESGLGFQGAAGIGEVEDYLLPSSIPVTLVGDFNGDRSVDQLDFDIWRETFGSTIDLRADANHNGVVDQSDYILWRKFDGTSAAAAAASTFAPRYGVMPIFADMQAGMLRTTTVAQPGASVVSATGPLFVGLDSGGSTSRLGFSPTSRGAATIQSEVSDTGLLILDQAWAELDNEDDGADAPSISWSGDDSSIDDEALAALFSDDAELWKAL